MKIIDKPIDAACNISEEGEIALIKFRVTDEEGEQQVVDKIKVLSIDKEKEKLKYRCVILLNSVLHECEIIYHKVSMVYRV